MASTVALSFFLICVSLCAVTMPAKRSVSPVEPRPQIMDTDCTDASPSAEAPQPVTAERSITAASAITANFFILFLLAP